MRSRCLLLLTLCFTTPMLGQDTLHRSVYVGIDVLKNIWPLIRAYPDVRSVFVIEPTVSIPVQRTGTWLNITPGYAGFAGKPLTDGNSNVLSGRGYYLKVGIERRKYRVGVGCAGLLTSWEDEGTYRFNGSYFGDYVGLIPPKTRTAVGGELFLSVFTSTRRRWAIRFQPRLTVIAPFTSHTDRPDPPFLPGVGLLAGNLWKLSSGLSVQLFYRTSPFRQ